jgi:hypothetical protein
MTCEIEPLFAYQNARPLATLPLVEISFGYKWHCRGDPSNYHVYPVVCQGGRVEDMRAPPYSHHRSRTVSLESPLQTADNDGWTPALSEGQKGTEKEEEEEGEDLFWAFRSSGLSLHLSSKLLPPRATDLPLHFEGDCSPLFTTNSSMPGATAAAGGIPRPMPPHPVMVVYSTALGWLLNWANAFKRIPPVPYPAKCRPALDSGIWGLKAAIRSITIDAIGIEGDSEYLILDEPDTSTQVGGVHCFNLFSVLTAEFIFVWVFILFCFLIYLRMVHTLLSRRAAFAFSSTALLLPCA